MTMTSVAAGKKPNGSPPADLHTTLRRIDERLAALPTHRLEAPR